MNISETFKLKNLELRNRIVMPPMCMYSVEKKDGYLTEWHKTHYVSRAVGGVGLIIIEMTDVDPDGRTTNFDLGLWEDGQVTPLSEIVEQIHTAGAKVAIQIAHAGRKAEDALDPIAPSAIAYNDESRTPREMSSNDIKKVIEQFRNSAQRAIKAGVDAIELHAAHGYLIHQFQSSYTNKRTDEYGKNLAKFGCEVIAAVKSIMPQSMPLIVRISAVEYVDGGYSLDHSLLLGEAYKNAGADVFHITSGGEGAIGGIGKAQFSQGYQVPYAKAFKERLAVPVIAVGKIVDPLYANTIIEEASTDLVAIGRGILNDPYWTLHAFEALDFKHKSTPVPVQYSMAFHE